MCTRKFLLLLLFVFLSLKGFSAVFVVTSNADSGPGTLRDALTQAAANGSAEKDYINFNIVDLSEAGRTINLIAQLPDVSSNLVIDGSTQPGTAFGVSDTKVALFYNTPINQVLSGLFVNNANDVSIYGLYIKNLADVSKANLIYFWKGIDIEGGSNIQIGAAGKGNVVVGFQTALSTNTAINADHELYEITTGLAIKDNIFSIDADGKTLSTYPDGEVGLGELLGDINIGGTPVEGNLFAKGVSIGQDNSDSPLATILISNNKIGVDYDAQTAISGAFGIDVGSIDPNGDDIVTIQDNVIAYQNGGGAIDIGNLGKQVTIIRNYIGTNKTLQTTFPMGFFGIFIYGADPPVKIGDNDPADANYVTNCKPVAIYPYSDVMVNKNSFFCTIQAYPMHESSSETGERSFPVVDITKSTAITVTGTATPNSAIELFYSDKCGTCSPQTYFASVTTGTDGKWVYNGPVTGSVIASATINGNTSEFTRTSIDSSKIKVIAACNNNGLGSITGAVPESTTNIKWVDKNGNLVGTKADLLNVAPGVYKLIVQGGDCADSTSYYQIKNTFEVNDTHLKMINPSCNNSSGSISGLLITNNGNSATKLQWKDINGKDWGNNADIKNLPAGNYTLFITNKDESCSTIYGPIVLKNTTGPTIDEGQQQIQPTNCGQSTGAITNILVSGGTGTYQYVWLNSQQQQVGTTKDLTGVPGGVYRLKVTDGGSCGPIYSSDITIAEINEITLDESKVATAPASCNLNNGSVTGIVVSGATQYKWIDANGKSHTTPTPDLTNAPQGTYTLTASNGSGCTKSSRAYQIVQNPPIQFQLGMDNSISLDCSPTLSASISLTAPDPRMRSFRWVDSKNQTIGSGLKISNLLPGTYQLYITDENGCENYYSSYVVSPYTKFAVTPSSEMVNEQCGLKNGSIGAANVTGGIPPYTYSWTDANGTQIGTNNTIANLSAGTYFLNVSDGACGNIIIPYTITEESEDLPAPSVSNVQLCSSGSALLSVNNASATTLYRLYDDAGATQPLAEQTGGHFTVNVANNRSYFISEMNGTCESNRSEVKIAVGLSTLNIANSFTPNGDGINDYWQISNIENYPNAIIQVFNRYGQKLFESKGYSKPFDGTYSGKQLPSGVYYYIINLSTNCNLLSGSLTIIR